MFVKVNLIAVNPFFDAFSHSDMLGRLIFLGLIAISIITWVIVLHKAWLTYISRKNSLQFEGFLSGNKGNILAIDHSHLHDSALNPFSQLYHVLKKHTVDLLNKNRRFGEKQQLQNEEVIASYLSPSDIDIVESHLMTTIASQTKLLEKNLFILSTIVTLAPFLGLLGTVWGILTTFSQLQTQVGGSTNQMVLGGLSLALATTVLGLVDAIPALIGYNYLKNSIRDFQTEMECFSNEILASLEMQYRKVDVQ
ncbi:MAG: MotA/TolQ/ExbB proton channel family protein [Chlamydiota bacterium]|nr:MotA/TolQ/ExbB proton channel family protein [Chlamydiota bacterium]